MIYLINYARLCITKTKRGNRLEAGVHFLKKSNFGITKIYRDITFIPIGVKIYNFIILNWIRIIDVEILRKNQSGFPRN